MREPLRKTLTWSSRRRAALLASTSLVAALIAAPPASAQQALPTQGSVASGAAKINQSGAAMTITQTTPRAVINWNSFSIGAGDSVTFAQPNADSATLNRVTGATPSSIAGRLDANGQVFLVNPNGIAITRGGTVNVGAFAASTLAITDTDFNSGSLNFKGGGASAAVSNAGTITAAPGGFVGLLGGTVSNSGTITAPLGKVALGSGEQATLDLSGDGFLQVALPTDAKAADGKALVGVSGTVKAAGGIVAIKAATAANAVRNAINLSGVASARSARAVGGSIILGGGDGGDVKVSGALVASGRKGGGSISVSGRNVALNNARLMARSAAGAGGRVAVTGTGAVTLTGAQIDASGATGGGKIAVGGGPGGKGRLAHSTRTTIATSTLRADALTSGNGGAITIWSDGLTTVAATLTARGGALSGNGGSVETSGQTAHLNGIVVDTSAPHGAAGLWLIDPQDFTIAASGGDISGATLSANLTNGDITIRSSAGKTSGTGQISVDDNVTWSSGHTLTLDAYSNIIVNANITVAGSGNVSFIYGDTTQTPTTTGVGTSAGALQFAMTDTGSTASLTFANPAASVLTINGAVYKLLSTEASLAQLNGAGSNFALANDIALAQSYMGSVAQTFSGNLEGLGHTISNLTLTQGSAAYVGFFGQLTGGEVSNVFLANANVNGGAAASGVGALAGAVGSSYTDTAIVYNSGSSGTVTGTGSNIGGLVGYNYGLVQFGWSSANVNPTSSTGNAVGGLVGDNAGAVTTSFASGDVQGATLVGGLVGENTGYVNGGSSGNVSGNAEIGGVVGDNEFPDSADDSITLNGVTYTFGLISGAYGYGGVYGTPGAAGTQYAGGVVGFNGATLDSSFFNGPVSGGAYVGGVVGANSGSITTSYAINAVSGTSFVGGFAGANSGLIDSSFAMGAVRGTTDVGGFVGLEGALGEGASTVSNSYSTGAVSGAAGATGVGGLIGLVTAGAADTITNAYWDTTTTGLSGPTASAGGVGHTTAELQGGTTLAFAGVNGVSNFAGGAAGGETGVYPYLTTFFANVRAISGFAYTNAAGTVPLASSANGAATVYVDTAGSTKNPSTTGVNGYYYVFLDPTTKLPSGANVVAYTVLDTNPAPNTGATNAATYAENVTANNTSVNILGLTLTEPTALPNYSSLAKAVATATAGDTAATGAIGGVSFINIAASAAPFTVDQAISTTAALTLTAPQTVLAANVTATGGVTLNGPVTVQSTTNVTLDSGAAATTLSSTLTVDSVGLSVTGALSVNGLTTVVGALDLGGANQTLATVQLQGGAIQDGNLVANITSSGGSISALLTGATTLTTTAGVTVLSNGANSQTGATSVTGGELSATVNGALSAGSVTTVNADGTLLLNGTTQNVASVILAGGAIQSGVFSNAAGVSSSGGALSGLTLTGVLTTTGGTTTLSGTNKFAGVTNGAGAVIVNSGVTTDDLNNAGTYTNNGTENANVASNTGTITNSAGATWNGNVNAGANVAGGVIDNLGAWTGTGSNDGGALNNSGSWTGAIDNNSGVLTTTGAIAGGVTNAGAVNAAGTIDGPIANNAGTFTVTGALASDNVSTFTNASGATLDVNGGAFTNLATLDNLPGGVVTVENYFTVATLNQSGTFTNTGPGVTATTVVQSAGLLTNSGDLTATNPIAVNGGVLANNGQITGAVTNAATFDNNTTGAVSAGLVNNAGTTANAGVIGGGATVNGGALTFTQQISTVIGGLTNAGTVNAQGLIFGGVTNTGAFVVNGNLDNTGGNFTNSGTGTLSFAADSLTYKGIATLANSSTASPGVNVNFANDALVATAAISNSAGATFASIGTVQAPAFNNAGTANLANVVDAAVTNSGALTTTGPATFQASVSNTAAGTINVNAAVVFAASITNAGTMNVNGAAVLDANVTNTGALAFNGPVIADASIAFDSTGGTLSFGSTIDSGTTTLLPPSCYSNCTTSEAYDLTIIGGALSFGGAIGGQYAFRTVSITSPDSLTLPSITAETIFARSTGANLTLGAGTTLTASGPGAAVTLAAAGAFVNDAGAGAIDLTGSSANWLIYSNNPTADTFGALNSNNYAIWNTSYPAATPPTGADAYIFAFQPTATFTSVNDAKTYGQDVTARVATDFTVTLQPGVAGAFLADTAARAFSGAPGVTSTGSPTAAGVAGAPYAITVAQGSLAALNGYALTFVSSGQLTVSPEPVTITATPATKTFDGTTSSNATPAVTAGTLFDPATLSESFASPGPGSAISLIPAVAFANAGAAGNYEITLVPTGTTPPNTGVILPLQPIQVNLSPSVFVDRNPELGIPGAASTCGVDLQLPQAETFSDPVAAIQAISAATAQYVERCRDASQEDIANALDRYADALEIVIQKLPPKLRAQLRHIPALVHAAAVRARAAPTRAAAVRVLKQTVAQVHREIALVRADDPDSARIRSAVNTGVSGVLNSAALSLARAEGI